MAKTQIFENYESFLNRDDKSINGVTEDFVKKHGIDLDVDNGNYGCWNCKDCRYCEYCKDCMGCFNCKDCNDCYECYQCYDWEACENE